MADAPLALENDDYPASPATTGVLTLGGSVSGTLEVIEDIDWFAITLAPGQTFDVTGHNLDMLFYDAAGDLVPVTYFRVYNANFSMVSTAFSSATGGTYYVAVSNGGLDAHYTLTGSLADPANPNNVAYFPMVDDGYTRTGTFDSNHSDWLSIELTAGESVCIDGEWARFYSIFGESLQATDRVDRDGNYFTVFTAEESGTYYFTPFGDPGDPYQFDTHIYVDDFADGVGALGSPPEALGVLNPAGATIHGTFEVEEEYDTFSIALVAGQTVHLHIEFAGPHAQAIQMMVDYGVSGRFHGQAENSEFGDLVFTAPETRTYYFSADPTFGYVGDYTLTIETVGANSAYDGAPSILPALPTRPSAPTTTETVLMMDGGAHLNAAGTTIYGVNLYTPGTTGTFPYLLGGGTSLVYASDSPHFSTVLTNAGMIWNSSTLYATIAVLTEALVNTGTIVSEFNLPDAGDGFTYYGAARGVLLSFGNLNNSGLIFATSEGSSAFGIESEGANASIINSGTIAARGTWGHDPSQSGGAFGIFADNNIALVNQASGKILAEGDGDTYAVRIERGGFLTDTPQVLNYGLIEAHARGKFATSFGVWIASAAVESNGIENYGTIRADFAIYAPSEGTFNLTSPAQNPQTVTNHAGGLIDGDIALFRGNDVIHNQGVITGHVDMGDDADLFDNVGGLVNGTVDLSFGVDTYIGGNSADIALGGHGDDTLSGGEGKDLLLGGYSNDVIAGGGGNDGLYGEWGDDEIVTQAGDVVSGGGGADRIQTTDYRFASIKGGADFDTWVLPSGAKILNLALVATSGRVTGIDAIELAGSQTLVIHAADVTALSDGASLFISGTNSDSVYLAGAWTSNGPFVLDGVTYARYSLSGVSVFVESGLASVIGAAPPAGVGLDAVSSGGAAPLPGSVEGTDLLPLEMDIEAFFIMDDLVIGRDEVWQNLIGTSVLGSNSFTSGLTNYGAIVAASNGLSDIAGPIGTAYGVNMNVVEYINNFGSIVATAMQGGTAFAYRGSALSFVNGVDGTIHAYADAGFAIAIDGFETSVDDPAVLNHGDIYAFSNSGFAIALSEFNGGIIENHGTIEADGGDGAIAIDLSNAGGSVTNSGDIIAYAPLTSSYYAVAIAFDTEAILFNSGYIAADIAVSIRNRYGVIAEITNTGTIIGAIQQTHKDDFYGGMNLNNSGDIFGAIILEDGTSTSHIVNSGSIEGDIFFGSGADTYNGGGKLLGDLHAGAGNDVLTGGNLADRFFGDAGHDELRGGDGADWLDGGAGADILQGGAGNDTYGVDSASDVVTELANQGIDTIRSSITWHLSATFEHLTLLGAAAIDGYGTDAANILIGSNGANRLVGGGGDDTLEGRLGADTMIGGTGNDIYDVDNAADRTIEDVNAGIDLVRSSVTRSLGVNLENLTLTGAAAINGAGNALANLIIGNDGANVLDGAGGDDRLEGGFGNDTLRGGLGVDTMLGGFGNDTYEVDVAGDRTIEVAEGGVDTVRSSLARTLGEHFENLTLIGSAAINGAGNALGNQILGNGAANTLDGRDGDDRLDGGGGNDTLRGGIGVDTMLGGAGNDLYEVDVAGDRTIELVDAGIDTVRSGVARTLGDNLENLTLTGAAAINGIGNALANVIVGNGAANLLDGVDGNDRLEGGGGSDTLRGGAGADTMLGGAGDDLYEVDNTGDRTLETLDAGVDTVRSSVTRTLGEHLENLTLIGTAVISGGGNALANIIIGNGVANLLDGGDGNDRLDGAGGADTLRGGLGADTLRGGAGGDALNGGDGIDIADYSTSAVRVRADLATGICLDGDAQGDTLANIEGLTGSAFNDILTGNTAANILAGGAGADALNGGDGADTADYSASAARVRINLTTGVALDADAAGDTLASIENLTGSAFNDTLAGSAGANVLVGGAGHDQISGAGGNDTLTGGAGLDSFVFNTALGAGNIDAITDFSGLDDTISLDDAIFAGLAVGALAASAFVTGTAAADANDRIIYNAITGTLSFDADGNGAGAAVQFASLGAGLSLTNADFLVI